MRIPTNALFAAIAATAVAANACKKTPTPAQEGGAASMASATPPAPADWTLDEMKEVKTTSPVDGIAVFADELDRNGKERAPYPMVEHGHGCTPDAGEEQACNSEWYRAISEHRKAKRGVFALVTRANHIESITDQAALRALLGEIDTPMEAALLASFASQSKIWSPQCTGFTRTIIVRTASAGGYEMAMERRARKGTLKMPDGTVMCEDCMILDKKPAVVRRDGEITFGATEQIQEVRMGCGRSPGWKCAAFERMTARTAGEYLAGAAHLEAASVAAFERIAEELAALGAPRGLVMRALRAAMEEEEHARIVGELARAHGVEPFPFYARTYPLRDAFELALDNAVEGRVNETYGALVLHVQALVAEDAAQRRAFSRIAADETRHAELSQDVGQWLDARLSTEARARVAAASAQARAALSRSAERPALADDRERRRIGLPDVPTSRTLFALAFAR